MLAPIRDRGGSGLLADSLVPKIRFKGVGVSLFRRFIFAGYVFQLMESTMLLCRWYAPSIPFICIWKESSLPTTSQFENIILPILYDVQYAVVLEANAGHFLVQVASNWHCFGVLYHTRTAVLAFQRSMGCFWSMKMTYRLL